MPCRTEMLVDSEKYNRLIRVACKALRLLEESNLIDKLDIECKTWWIEHKEEDRKIKEWETRRKIYHKAEIEKQIKKLQKELKNL